MFWFYNQFFIWLLICQLLRAQHHVSPVDARHRADHEAVLGKDEANKFDHMTPSESQKQLEKIAHKMDVNKDGHVSLEELQQWISKTQREYAEKDLEKQWKTHNPSGMEKLSWDEYRLASYSFLDNEDNGVGEEDMKVYRAMERRDKRRWALADQNGDNLLNKKEFERLIHPEQHTDMHEVVVDETLEDIDKDGDGQVSLKEYIADMWNLEQTEYGEPDWIQLEKKHFREQRDINKDGVLDKNEVRKWLISPNSHSEAHHLIEEADENKDGKLSIQEILQNYDTFVGSEATDFGQALQPHDEL